MRAAHDGVPTAGARRDAACDPLGEVDADVMLCPEWAAFLRAGLERRQERQQERALARRRETKNERQRRRRKRRQGERQQQAAGGQPAQASADSSQSLTEST